MFLHIKKYFSPINISGDEEITRKAKVFHILWLYIWAVVVIHIVGLLFIYINKPMTAVLILGVVLVQSSSRFYYVRGRLKTASQISIYGLWLMNMMLVILSGTQKSILVSMPMAISAMSALVLGPRTSIRLALLTLITTLSMVIVNTTGTPLPVRLPVPPMANWLNSVISFILMIAPLNTALNLLRTALANAQHNHQRYKNLIEYAPAMYILLREDAGVQVIDDCNTAFLETLGYAKHEVVGHPLERFYTTASQQILNEQDNFQLGLDNKLNTPAERYLIAKEGQIIPTVVQFAPEVSEDGARPKVVGMFVNINEWKQAEQDLRESESRYRALFENLPIPAFTKNLAGEYTSSNTENRKYFPENPIGKTDHQLFAPAVAQELRQHDLQVLENNTVTVAEELIITEDQSERYFLSQKRPVYDHAGEVSGVLGVSMDITDQKKIDRTLYFLTQKEWIEKGENFFVALAAHLGDTLAVDYVFINEIEHATHRAHTLGNYSLGEIQPNFEYDLKDTPCENIQGDKLCTYPAGIQEKFPEDTALVDMEAESYSGIPLWNSTGNSIGLIAILHREQFANISIVEAILQIVASSAGKEIERLAAEKKVLMLHAELEQRVARRTTQLETANEQLKSFSYSVSHDLRAPLRAIVGYSNILQNDYAKQLDEEGQSYLLRMRESGEMMNLFIQDLLLFSQVNQEEVHKQTVDLVELIDSVLEILQPHIENPQTQFIVAKDFPLCAADPLLLKQVFTNLIENAIKYSHTQALPQIHIGWQPQADETLYFVQDNGVGFDMQYSHKIFGVFQRLHSTQEFEGTGVGLAIVQRIIQQHGGRIWVEAEKGLGATFFFTL